MHILTFSNSYEIHIYFFHLKEVCICECICYLQLSNKSPQMYRLTTKILSYSFCWSGTWACLSWVLCFRLGVSHIMTKVWSSHLKSELGKDPLPISLVCLCGSIQSLTGCCSEGLSSLLAVGWRQRSVLSLSLPVLIYLLCWITCYCPNLPCIFFKLKKKCLFLTEHEQARGRERRRHRIWTRL